MNDIESRTTEFKDNKQRTAAHLDNWLKSIQELVRLLETTLKVERLGTDKLKNKISTYTWNASSLLGELNLPNELILLIADARDFDEEAIVSIRAFIREELLHDQVILLTLLGRVPEFTQAANLADIKLRQTYAYNLVVLSKDLLMSIIAHSDPLRKLRQVILSKINLITISPFTITGPAADRVFFGREREIKQIAEHAATESYAIIGGRRIGKTSILNRLHRIRLPDIGFRTIYHDASATPSYEAFFSSYARAWQPEPPPVPVYTFSDLIHSPKTDKPLVLLIDEADKLIRPDRADNWRLFNTLRALVATNNIQVILSGEQTLREALQDSVSPLFNFANEVLLGPLDFHAVEELVCQPMKRLEIHLIDEAEIVRSIYDFTSGHPNVVQRLCSRLINMLNERDIRSIMLDDVSAVIEDPDFQRNDLLGTFFEAATLLERIISLLMADDQNARTLPAIRQAITKRCNLQPRFREVDGALQRLVDLRLILKRTPIGYEFASEAFPRVIAGTMTLDDMLEILTEEYQEQGE